MPRPQSVRPLLAWRGGGGGGGRDGGLPTPSAWGRVSARLSLNGRCCCVWKHPTVVGACRGRVCCFSSCGGEGQRIVCVQVFACALTPACGVRASRSPRQLRSRQCVCACVRTLSPCPALPRRGRACRRLREGSQISRICGVADPLVDIVYVSPFPLPETVLAYYRKMIEVWALYLSHAHSHAHTHSHRHARTRMHAHTHSHTHTRMHTLTRTLTDTRAHACTHTHAHTHAHTCTRARAFHNSRAPCS